MKKNYTIGEIQDLARYLNDCYITGQIGEKECDRIMEEQDWEAVEKMKMAGDDHANETQEEEA